MLSPQLQYDITKTTAWALREDLTNDDIISQDISAELIPATNNAVARIISREDCVICGVAWVNEVFKQLDQQVGLTGEQATKINWFVADGDHVSANSTLFELSGNARILLTGERSALNFLQTLSATATITNTYAKELSHTNTKLLDTRKTIPGLRSAQKYAVTCGGGVNHRVGLFDAFLIKENHIAACGGITAAIETARKNHPAKTIEIEVESLDELQQALSASADIVMLDNFTHEMINNGIALTNEIAKSTGKRTKIEVSGDMTINTLASYAIDGVDFISVGALTKHVQAIDLSMRFF